VEVNRPPHIFPVQILDFCFHDTAIPQFLSLETPHCRIEYPFWSPLFTWKIPWTYFPCSLIYLTCFFFHTNPNSEAAPISISIATDYSSSLPYLLSLSSGFSRLQSPPTFTTIQHKHSFLLLSLICARDLNPLQSLFRLILPLERVPKRGDFYLFKPKMDLTGNCAFFHFPIQSRIVFSYIKRSRYVKTGLFFQHSPVAVHFPGFNPVPPPSNISNLSDPVPPPLLYCMTVTDSDRQRFLPQCSPFEPVLRFPKRKKTFSLPPFMCSLLFWKQMRSLMKM